MRKHKIRSGMIGLALILAPSIAQAQSADPLAPTGRWTANTDGRAATPPMGWNSWNAFFTDMDEEKVLASAQKIVSSGLAAKGYRYINLDEGWWEKRREDGRMLVRTEKFPSARTDDGSTSFRPFADRLHAMGLKAGLYSDLGRNTCAQAYMPDEPNLPRGNVREREVGLYGHIDRDIGLYFGEWGFDYIKIDGCGLRAYGPDSALVKSGRYRELDPILDLRDVNKSDIPAVRNLFEQVKVALARHASDGDYLLSLCIWGSANVRSWGKDVGNISRTSDDIAPRWDALLTNFDTAATRALYAHPGSWNDPDMLFIGKGDFDEHHLVEAQSHFALWAMLNAPLLIGTDLRKTPPLLMDVFGNDRLIAINQDRGGHQAVVADRQGDIQTLVKTLANGDKAVAILNRGSTPQDATLNAAQLNFRNDAPVGLVDLWNGTAVDFTGERSFRLAPHQTLVFRANGARSLTDGMYLSELPGVVNPAVDGVVRPKPDPTIDPPIYAGWGGAQADRTPYDRGLQVAGRHFVNGIGVLSNSRLEVKNQRYRRLTVSVGVDNSATDAKRPVTFIIYGDGRPLARSAALRRGDAAQDLAVNTSGVKLLELVARSEGTDNEALPVTWGDVAFRR